MYCINMKNVKTAWKRSKSGLSLKDWAKLFGNEWAISFENKMIEKHQNWETLHKKNDGTFTKKAAKICIN